MNTFKKAICRGIPRSIVNDGLRMENNESPLDYDLAVKQQSYYIDALKKAGLEVTFLPADESLPDCVFVEDVAVVIRDKVLITIPGAVSRRNETNAVKEVLEKEPCMNILEMKSPAMLDGGDVLFTGREIFVGLSQRTNEEGIAALRETFKDFKVHAIPIEDSTLHLKSVMTMVSDDTITCADTNNGRKIMGKVEKVTTVKYNYIFVPDELAANCVLVNGKLLCHSAERFKNSISKYEALPVELIQLESTELEKVDGSFTCCSILY